MSNPKYYKAVDGLRALAVVFVLIFHVGAHWLPGGFLGVDVFFVISGFLITGNILREVKNGDFSLKRFYLRRLARLHPALLVMILFTLAAGVVWLPPSDLQRLAGSAVAAMFSVSNILFWEQAGYFEPAGNAKPLLHTWSLGVEDQFYLVWPFLILIAAKGGRRSLLGALVLAALSSLVASAFLEKTHPDAIFYLTPLRVFQFAIGALIAVLGVGPGGRESLIVAGLGVATLCVLGVKIVGGAPLNGGSVGHLAIVGLAPALATAAFLWGCLNPLIVRIFASALIGTIGRASYSIYLVHWPLIVFFQITRGGFIPLTVYEQAVLISSSLVSGWLLHVFVERRFRLDPGFHTEPARSMRFIGGLGLIVLGASAGLGFTGGIPERFDNRLRLTAEQVNRVRNAKEAAIKAGVCTLFWDRQTIRNYKLDVCATPPPGRPGWLVLGDSWAGDTKLVFAKAYPDVYFALMSVPGCPLRLPGDFRLDEQPTCRDMYAFAFDKLVDRSRFDGVIFSSMWGPPYVPYEEVQQMINLAQSRGLKVIVVGQHIRFNDTPVPTMVLTTGSFIEAQAVADKLSERRARTTRDRKLRAVLDPKVPFVDFLDLQCELDCEIIGKEGRLLYIDNTHLSLDGIDNVAAKFISRYSHQLPINAEKP